MARVFAWQHSVFVLCGEKRMSGKATRMARLFRVAAAHEREHALKEGLSRVVVAAVGPVVADALAMHGIRVQAIPAGSYFMKPLSVALAEALSR
jgi:uroporphyrinogen-III synthase